METENTKVEIRDLELSFTARFHLGEGDNLLEAVLNALDDKLATIMDAAGAKAEAEIAPAKQEPVVVQKSAVPVVPRKAKRLAAKSGDVSKWGSLPTADIEFLKTKGIKSLEDLEGANYSRVNAVCGGKNRRRHGLVLDACRKAGIHIKPKLNRGRTGVRKMTSAKKKFGDFTRLDETGMETNSASLLAELNVLTIGKLKTLSMADIEAVFQNEPRLLKEFVAFSSDKLGIAFTDGEDPATPPANGKSNSDLLNKLGLSV